MYQSVYDVRDIEANPFADKPHHRPKSFANPPGSPHSKDGRYTLGMLSLLAELAFTVNKKFHYPANHNVEREESLSQLAQHKAQDSITWLGQACFYITIGGKKVLTDPFLSDRASPTSFTGPKRLVPTPLKISDLDIDLIVISHNHYDHLDLPTLKLWKDKTTPIITTLGTGRPIRNLGFSNVSELDWYQQVKIQGTELTCCPAYHFSGRSMVDSNKSLWGSFFIKVNDASIFFAGDTGYGAEFKRIRELLGPVDTALVPIGAYAPRKVMSRVHTNPEEGVQIGIDLAAQNIIPMHWGTVRLTNEPMMEPKQRFDKAIQQNGLRGKTIAIGETRGL